MDAWIDLDRKVREDIGEMYKQAALDVLWAHGKVNHPDMTGGIRWVREVESVSWAEMSDVADSLSSD